MISQMEIKPIKNAADHAALLREINGLMSAELGTPEGIGWTCWPLSSKRMRPGTSRWSMIKQPAAVAA
jgi:hypothetical protein